MTGAAELGLRGVTVDLPVLSARSRSLRKAFVHGAPAAAWAPRAGP